jgi:serine/threonine protein kinase
MRDMFACVAALRQLDIVHRDLTPRHFLRCDNEALSASHGLFLIDFGFAVLLPLNDDDCQDREVTFCGSTYFAPTSLLQQLAAQPPPTFISPPFLYTPQLAHDLESLVKVCFACVYPDQLADLRRLDNKDTKSILQFWLQLEARLHTTQPCWWSALQHAKRDEWDKARIEMEKNFG